MNNYMITFLLLLFDLSFNNGHTLSKLKMNNLTDLYEVEGDKSSLAITYPEEDKPTLREIVYYHIIERPYYDKNSENHMLNEAPDVAIPRSFTNSHGYQFLEEIAAPKEDDDEPVNLDITDEEIENTGITKAKPEIVDENDDKDKELADDEVYENDKSIAGVNTVAQDIRFGDNHVNTTEEPGATQLKPKSRKKREINQTDLPDAPSLPEFKLNDLPDYIKSILLEEPGTKNLEEIEQQVRTLEKAVNNPPTENADNVNQKRKARTYGMSLMANGGVVWNDLNTDHVSYHVGELENAPSALKPEEAPDTTLTVESTKDTFNYSEKNNDENDDNNEDSGNGDVELKEIEESFDEIQKIFKDLIKDSTSKPEITVSSDKEESKNPGSQTDFSTENKGIETAKTNAGDKNSSGTPKPDSKEKITVEEMPDTYEEKKRKDKNKETTNHKNEESKQQQFVKELMKNKYFWQLITDSSVAYLEIMMKKVDALIKAEVDTQIKQHFEEHKTNTSNCKSDDKNKAAENTTSEEPVKTSNMTDAEIINTTQTLIVNSTELNDIALNKTVLDMPMNTANETEKELARKHTNKESDNKKIDAPVQIEAQNVYGNSVGSGKVTNIFIFNISKASDLKNVKPLTNGTNGVLAFGLDDKNPVSEKGEKDETTEGHKNENKTDTILGNITANPEEPNEQNHNIEKESKDNKPDINQISTTEPETVNYPINDEVKDNIIDETSKDENENTSNENDSTLNNEETTSKQLHVYFDATTESLSNNEAASTTEKTKKQTEAPEELAEEDEHETKKSEAIENPRDTTLGDINITSSQNETNVDSKDGDEKAPVNMDTEVTTESTNSENSELNDTDIKMDIKK